MKHMKATITAREQTDIHNTKNDVFESAYATFFNKLNIQLQIVSCMSDISEVNLEGIDLVVLSGGGSVPRSYFDLENSLEEQSNRDKIESHLIKKSIERDIPLLGICRGMQFINGWFGGKVSKIVKSEHKVGVEHYINFSNKKIKVNSYHNDCVYLHNLSNKLLPLAIHDDDDDESIVEAFFASQYKILGLQWHPERSFENYASFQFSINLIEHFLGGGIFDKSSNFSSR